MFKSKRGTFNQKGIKTFPIGKRPRVKFAPHLKMRSSGLAINLGLCHIKTSHSSAFSNVLKTMIHAWPIAPMVKPAKKGHPWVKRVIRQLNTRREKDSEARNEAFWCPFSANQRIETLPLMSWAIRHRDYDAVKVMLKFGTNPNLAGAQNDNTPIQTAVRIHEVLDIPSDIRELLIRHGAEPVWRGDENLDKVNDWEMIWLMIEEERKLSVLPGALSKTDIPVNRL